MKRRICLMGTLLVLMGMLLIGCMRVEEAFTIKSDGSGNVSMGVFVEKEAVLGYLEEMGAEEEEGMSAEEMLQELIDMEAYRLVEMDGKEYLAMPESGERYLEFQKVAEFYQNDVFGRLMYAQEDNYISLTETSLEAAIPAESTSELAGFDSMLTDASGNAVLEQMLAQMKEGTLFFEVTFDTPVVKISENAMLSDDKKTVRFSLPMAAEETSKFYAYCENDFAVTGAQSGRIYGTDISFDLPEGATAAVNGTAQSGSRILCNQTGTYEVVLKKDGTQKTLYFMIDKEAPKVKNFTANGYYNKKFTVQLEDAQSGIGRAYLDGKEITTELSINMDDDALTMNEIGYTYTFSGLKDGKHTLIVEDTVGNQYKGTFTFDKTAPTVKGVKNGKTYKKTVTIKVKDAYGVKSITLNGKKIASGKKIAKKGSYKLVVKDKAGNTKTLRFKIKK